MVIDDGYVSLLERKTDRRCEPGAADRLADHQNQPRRIYVVLAPSAPAFKPIATVTPT